MFCSTDPVLGAGSWQATSSSLQSSAVQNWVGNSLDIHHYAFLAGRDGSGAIGVAYVGTPCFRLSGGKWNLTIFLKMFRLYENTE